MKPISIVARLARLTALACLAACGAVSAQTYPTKPVRMIVPYAPGGAPDVVARSLGMKLQESLGQPFVVDNKPGAGGIGAAEILTHSAPDGATVFFSDIQQLAINPYIFKKLPYDSAKDFQPVMLIAALPLYVAVQSSTGINSLADLVAYAKAKPGVLNYGSSGIGSIHHITMAAMLGSLGIDVTHIPYKGAGQSVPAFIGGETTMVIAVLPQLEPQVKAGKAKLIAVTTLKRSALSPDVPAVSETIPGFDYSSEMGVVVPAGTPAAVVSTLSREMTKALKDPATVTRLNNMGATIIASTPEGYADNIRANLIKFKQAIQVAGVKAE